jgi:hypothetical protein
LTTRGIYWKNSQNENPRFISWGKIKNGSVKHSKKGVDFEDIGSRSYSIEIESDARGKISGKFPYLA